MATSFSKTPLYEGKAKVLFQGPTPGTLIQHFKDDATAFNKQKTGTIAGKGILNNRISEFLMTQIESIGIPTHFIRTLNMREQLIKTAEIIPLEVVVRNIAAGTICKRLNIEEGTTLPVPLLEFYYKDDALGDPLISEQHAFILGYADPFELEEIKHYTLRINDFLRGIFAGIGIILVDFKIEFGRHKDEDGEIKVILADEISPDSCRLWDRKTLNKLDKDRFRRDLGNVAEAYQEVARRLGVLVENINSETGGF